MSGNPNMRPACEDGGCGIAARNETKSRTLFRMSFAGPTGGTNHGDKDQTFGGDQQVRRWGEQRLSCQQQRAAIRSSVDLMIEGCKWVS